MVRESAVGGFFIVVLIFRFIVIWYFAMCFNTGIIIIIIIQSFISIFTIHIIYCVLLDYEILGYESTFGFRKPFLVVEKV